MKDLFVPYEIALQLKELGFNEPCFKKYIAGCLWSSPTVPEIYENIHPNSSDCLAPTFSQAFRWFREKYSLNHEISYAGKSGQYHAFVKSYVYGNNGNNPSVFTYEEAELACIKKLIELKRNNQLLNFF